MGSSEQHIIEVSELGLNWDGEELNENNLHSNQLVCYGGKMFTTGNRHTLSVELYSITNMKFKRIVRCNEIRLVKNKLKRNDYGLIEGVQ